MTTPSMRRHPIDPHGDSGVALIMVMVSMTILALFAGVALTYSTQTLKTTRHTQDTISALQAAQSGVDEYIARLNRNDAYWQTVPDCTNPAMRKFFAGNLCGWTSATTLGWATIPGPTLASFHYDADTTAMPNNGTINLKVTGKVNKVNRTIEVTLRHAGFGEFLYYTDYETIDPGNEAVYGANNGTALDKCSHHFWDPNQPPSKPRDTSYCWDIQFITGDSINGPTHSNDAILMSGTPTFRGAVSTSWPNCKPVNGVAQPADHCYRTAAGGANPAFNPSITYRDPVDLPASNGSLLSFVDPVVTTNPGCLYTGPTRIKFLAPTVAGAPGTMQVWSPFSKTLNTGCGTPSNPFGDVNDWPQTLTVPNNNIIIVRNVPAGSGWSLPNSSLANNGSCAAGKIGDNFPQNGDLNQNLDEADCKNGTVYVEGSLAGQVTISAENNIIITGDLTYNGGTNGKDVLGLIANNSVQIYHPVNNSGNMDRPNGTKFTDPKIHAAILTLQHSFIVQSYDKGNHSSLVAPGGTGSIHLFGSFAQKYRGPVGTSSGGSPVSGYLKDYVYDTRLKQYAPPKFLDPVHATWGAKTFGEIQAQYVGQ